MLKKILKKLNLKKLGVFMAVTLVAAGVSTSVFTQKAYARDWLDISHPLNFVADIGDGIKDASTYATNTLSITSDNGMIKDKKQYTWIDFTSFFLNEGAPKSTSERSSKGSDNAGDRANRLQALANNDLITSYSYESPSAVGAISSAFGMIFRGLYVIILLVGIILYMIYASLIGMVGKIMNFFNIWSYVGDSVNRDIISNAGNSQQGMALALSPIINALRSFAPLAIIISAVVFMVTIFVVTIGFGKRGNSSGGSAGGRLGRGFFRMIGVIFAWTLMPLSIGGLISGAASLIDSSNTDYNMGLTAVSQSFYDTKSLFKTATYDTTADTDNKINNLSNVDVGFNTVSTNENTGLMDTAINKNFVSNSHKSLSAMIDKNSLYQPDFGDVSTFLVGWMTNATFDAKDVKADMDLDDLMKGADQDGQDKATAREQFKKANPFLYQKIQDVDNGGFGTYQGWDSEASAEKRGYVMNSALMTYNLAFMNIKPNAEGPQLTQVLKMDADPNYQFSRYHLVGGTFFGKFGRSLDLINILVFSALFGLITFYAIVMTLGRMLTQIFASYAGTLATGSWPMIVKTYLFVFAMILDVVVLLLIGQAFPIVYSSLGNFIAYVLHMTGGQQSVTALGIAIFIKGVLGFIIALISATILWNLRKAISDGATALINRMAEILDQAAGIQPGANGGVSNAMHRAADDMQNSFGLNNVTGRQLSSGLGDAVAGAGMMGLRGGKALANTVGDNTKFGKDGTTLSQGMRNVGFGAANAMRRFPVSGRAGEALNDALHSHENKVNDRQEKKDAVKDGTAAQRELARNTADKSADEVTKDRMSKVDELESAATTAAAIDDVRNRRYNGASLEEISNDSSVSQPAREVAQKAMSGAEGSSLDAQEETARQRLEKAVTTTQNMVQGENAFATTDSVGTMRQKVQADRDNLAQANLADITQRVRLGQEAGNSMKEEQIQQKIKKAENSVAHGGTIAQMIREDVTRQPSEPKVLRQRVDQVRGNQLGVETMSDIRQRVNQEQGTRLTGNVNDAEQKVNQKRGNTLRGGVNDETQTVNQKQGNVIHGGVNDITQTVNQERGKTVRGGVGDLTQTVNQERGNTVRGGVSDETQTVNQRRNLSDHDVRVEDSIKSSENLRDQMNALNGDSGEE